MFHGGGGTALDNRELHAVYAGCSALRVLSLVASKWASAAPVPQLVFSSRLSQMAVHLHDSHGSADTEAAEPGKGEWISHAFAGGGGD